MILGTSRGSLRTRTDVSGLDRDVGSGADRDPDVGRHQRRRIVDAVADHRDPLACAWSSSILLALSLGQHLGEHCVDAELRADGFRDRPASPVIMMTSMCLVEPSIASLDSGRIASATARRREHGLLVGEIDRGLARAARRARSRLRSSGSRFERQRAQQRRPADVELAAVDVACTP